MDSTELKEWREKAESGSTVAHSVLGLSYLHGSGLPQDYGEALRYLTLAAEQGASRPLHHLGLMYEQGLGVPIDLERAFRLHKRGAERGEVTAFIHVARMYRYGRGTEADDRAALEWYEAILAEADDGWDFDYIQEAREYVASQDA